MAPSVVGADLIHGNACAQRHRPDHSPWRRWRALVDAVNAVRLLAVNRWAILTPISSGRFQIAHDPDGNMLGLLEPAQGPNNAPPYTVFFKIVQHLRGGRLIISPVIVHECCASGAVSMAIAAEEEALIKNPIRSCCLAAALQRKWLGCPGLFLVHQDMDDDLRHRLDFIETAIKLSHRLIITYRTGEENFHHNAPSVHCSHNYSGA